MKQKKVKMNTWDWDWNRLHSLNKEGQVKIFKDLSEVDNMISNIVPKMFFHYEFKGEEIFIVVPKEFEDNVKRKMGNIVVLRARPSVGVIVEKDSTYYLEERENKLLVEMVS